jgi:predicted transcriptional regulator
MPSRQPPALSRRERQILDIIYRLGRATAADVHGALPDRPTYTTVRGLLRVLVEKRHLRLEREGRKYVYTPSVPPREAGVSSISHIVRTFFAGSPADAMAALLGPGQEKLSDRELARLAELVDRARRTRKGSRR